MAQASEALLAFQKDPAAPGGPQCGDGEVWLVKVPSGYLDVADKEADQLMNGILLDAIDNLRVIGIIRITHTHCVRHSRSLTDSLVNVV